MRRIRYLRGTERKRSVASRLSLYPRISCLSRRLNAAGDLYLYRLRERPRLMFVIKHHLNNSPRRTVTSPRLPRMRTAGTTSYRVQWRHRAFDTRAGFRSGGRYTETRVKRSARFLLQAGGDGKADVREARQTGRNRRGKKSLSRRSKTSAPAYLIVICTLSQHPSCRYQSCAAVPRLFHASACTRGIADVRSARVN